MILSYEDFLNLIKGKIKDGNDLYDQILINVIDNPQRYSGIFRLSNPKNKLIQNITQSMEIKLGDVLEEIFEEYFKIYNYEILPKSLRTLDNKRLEVDHLIKKANNIYLVEQKIRDDHDSTKKTGQFKNFVKKIKTVIRDYPNNNIISIMWFVDDTLNKNKGYYLSEIDQMKINNVHLFYGESFFDFLGHNEIWSEVTDKLKFYRLNLDPEVLHIPDFGKSDVMLDALLRLPNNKWEKLISDDLIYKNLRIELFSEGENIEKATKLRN